MQIIEVMTANAECTHPGSSLREAAQRMRDLDVGSLPVCGDGDRLVGMITDRDIAIRGVAEGQDPDSVHVEQVMTPGIVYCFEDQDVSEAAQIMQDEQLRRLVVLNRDGRLVGIVSLGDLAVESGNTHLVGSTVEAVSEPSNQSR